jgi:hypothetical protein
MNDRQGRANIFADDQAGDHCHRDIALRVLAHEEPEGRRPAPQFASLGSFTAAKSAKQKAISPPSKLICAARSDDLADARSDGHVSVRLEPIA